MPWVRLLTRFQKRNGRAGLCLLVPPRIPHHSRLDWLDAFSCSCDCDETEDLNGDEPRFNPPLEGGLDWARQSSREGSYNPGSRGVPGHPVKPGGDKLT